MSQQWNKNTLLQRHNQGLCGCSVSTNPNACIYQPFLDGWDFTPDVGNGQSRGEIFTPRFIVDKMIAELNLFPKEALYEYDYSTLKPVQVRALLKSKIFEPAVGTGNFSSTIAWHKIEYANWLATNKNSVLNEKKYQLYTLEALASIYVNDIDCGNLQTFKWRILRTSEIYADHNIKFWQNYLTQHLPVKTEEQKQAVTDSVKSSLKVAAENWGVADEDKGVLDVLYYKHTNHRPPEWLKLLWKEILDENSKLFNAIKEEDSVEEAFFCPGWQKVEWTWWEFQKTTEGIIANKTTIPMALQIYSSQKETSEAEIADLLKRQKKVNRSGRADSELLVKPAFLNEEDKKTYLLKNRELNKLEKRIQHLEEHGIKVFKEIQQEKIVKPNQDTITLF